MLVCVSDLHLQDVLLDGPAKGDLNVPVETYREFFLKIAGEARAHDAKEIIFLLNGDIFDFLRTPRWFVGSPARPYAVPLDPASEGKVLEIWDGIVASNLETLELFRAISRNDRQTLGFEFPVPIQTRYIPGNHDRLVNLSMEVNKRVRSIFNLGLPRLFEHHWIASEYGIFARHGHEYDWQSSEYRIDGERTPDAALYDHSPIGDWFVVEVVSQLPYRFKEKFSEHPAFPDFYPRLFGLDDVRPAGAVLPWIKFTAGRSGEAWPLLRRCLAEVLEEALASPFLYQWLKRHDQPWSLDRADILSLLFATLRKGFEHLPDFIVEKALEYLSGGEDETVWERAAKDPAFVCSGMKTLVHGHYHDARIDFLDEHRFVVCTGSWRDRHHLCRDRRSFSRNKALNYATFYREDENPERGQTQRGGFEFWQGLTRQT